MKIISYYYHLADGGEVRNKAEKRLCDLWYKSWSDQGFDAIVLGVDDAKKHPLYNNLEAKWKIANQGTKYGWTEYGMSCWHRWLAYATLDLPDDEVIYVSDYDVFSRGYTPETFPIDTHKNLHFLSDCCPCLLRGSVDKFKQIPDWFNRFINEDTYDRIGNFIKAYTEEPHHWFNDQEFFCLFKPDMLKAGLPVVFSHNEATFVVTSPMLEAFTGTIDNSEVTTSIAHFSHHFSDVLGEEHLSDVRPKYETLDDFRIALIKYYIGWQKSL